MPAQLGSILILIPSAAKWHLAILEFIRMKWDHKKFFGKEFLKPDGPKAPTWSQQIIELIF